MDQKRNEGALHWLILNGGAALVDYRLHQPAVPPVVHRTPDHAARPRAKSEYVRKDREAGLPLDQAGEEIDARFGKTRYLSVKLNNTVLPRVGVFIPKGFPASSAVDSIVYFHGHMPPCNIDSDKFNAEGIEYYWNTPSFRFLREELSLSRCRAILIAPTFKAVAKKPRDFGDLDQGGKFDFLVNECLAHLKESNDLPREAQPRHIVLAGHSAGGKPMQSILHATNSLKQNIMECWGFECLYYGTEIWEQWLSHNTDKKFIHYRRCDQMSEPVDRLKKHSNFVDVHDGCSHCGLVKEEWRIAIDGCQWLPKGSEGATESRTLEWLAESQQTEVVVQVQPGGAASATPLRWTWVYWRDGGNLTRLHTDGAGRLFAMRSGGTPSHPWDYTTRFQAAPGAQVELFFSRSARPIPDAVLQANSGVFQTRRVAATISLPDIEIVITRPADLEFWPLLWELPRPEYHTQGLPQSAALWSGTSLTVTENGAAPAPMAAARPRERGLSVQGNVDARATGVTLRALDANGGPLRLRTDIAGTATVQEINARLGTATGDSRPFEAALFFADAANAFGPIQILAQSVGMTPPILAVASVYLCGCQIVLVDDHATNPNGQQREPVMGESDEKIIVDFLNSPQTSRNAISAETRARRMAVYSFANHRRRLDSTAPAGAGNPEVLKPQMPMWMAEFHMVGVTRGQLADLLALRYFRIHHGLIALSAESLQMDLQWKLTLKWDGPDINSSSFAFIPRHTQVYSYSQEFEATQTVQLHFGRQGELTDASGQPVTLGTDNAVPNAFVPSVTPPAFPVANRRRPQLIVVGQRRAWGREAAGTPKDTLVIEHQPVIADNNGREILRGGDGVLELVSLSMDNQPIDPGLIPGAGHALAPPTTTAPLIRLPEFRVNGTNPAPHTDVEALINALVEERYNLDAAQPRIALLSLQCWQTTARLILAHEAPGDRQFEDRGAGRRRFSQSGNMLFYGHETNMPFFGAPHGYGLGQLDDPPASNNAVWSFVENVRESIRRIMVNKASDAYALISTHLPATPNQRIRAIYQREIVRRYNGGREFRWNVSDWEIYPSLAQWANSHDHSQGANPRLDYPNRVLGTGVVYFTGAGAATTFPWPITFTAADFGPDT